MKKTFIILFLIASCILFSCLAQKNKSKLYDLDKTTTTNTAATESFKEIKDTAKGNAERGLQYLLHGNYINSGIPYSLYHALYETNFRNTISFFGYNRFEVNPFMTFNDSANNITIATPNCLHCHAQLFNDSLIIGMGNSYSQYQFNQTPDLIAGDLLVKLLYGKNSAAYQNAKQFFRNSLLSSKHLVTQTQGVNVADHIVNILAAYRNPNSLQIQYDSTLYPIPPVTLPTDTPPWWIAKKKKLWYYNGMAQGNILQHLIAASFLTYKDTTEVKNIYNEMKNVWAFIQSLKPPKYPKPINEKLAEEGETVFNNHCSGCHGTYGTDWDYPNRIVPIDEVKTDSLLIKYYQQYKGYENWYNNSWFAKTVYPSFIKPQKGYIAPPLDGIWCTAPYLHNGSVPTVEALLNSKKRPEYWKRNFSNTNYDYENLGWKYTVKKRGSLKVYNTNIPGYKNHGHYFGDELTDSERKAVLEYLKTL